jgi:hypothetical protein
MFVGRKVHAIEKPITALSESMVSQLWLESAGGPDAPKSLYRLRVWLGKGLGVARAPLATPPCRKLPGKAFLTRRQDIARSSGRLCYHGAHFCTDSSVAFTHALPKRSRFLEGDRPFSNYLFFRIAAP